ncbi:olfactory receptor 8B3-like [Leptonychotes weddellii]|uniref:Olfactory receptor 8B3-like n=1 Tax=Leptonychotes weddellii TaxID=9713 RepID=A0A2U3YS33_LEPWE|nr:olfactory receptor 8B3-like [Leptonychotes weddellii]
MDTRSSAVAFTYFTGIFHIPHSGVQREHGWDPQQWKRKIREDVISSLLRQPLIIRWGWWTFKAEVEQRQCSPDESQGYSVLPIWPLPSLNQLSHPGALLMGFVKENVISYAECMTQLCFFSFFVIDECCVLTSMAYDWYVAICKPLLYKAIMSHQVCLMLMAGAYVMGFVGAMAHTGCMLRLTFCGDNFINHYMCDIPPVLRLSCRSTYINELVVFTVVGVNVIVPSLTISISYTLILCSVFHIRSTEGRSKAFSTCSSHIVAVSLFFGSSAFMYLKSSPAGSLDQDKVSTVFYTIVGPVMNPFIYSLRNKDVKIALSKTLKKRMFS